MNRRDLHRCMSARIADPMFTTFTSVLHMFTPAFSAEALRGRPHTEAAQGDGERGERGELGRRMPAEREGEIQ